LTMSSQTPDARAAPATPLQFVQESPALYNEKTFQAAACMYKDKGISPRSQPRPARCYMPAPVLLSLSVGLGVACALDKTKKTASAREANPAY
jgi:hypothetical protein